MPGMTSGVGTANVLIAEAFRSALRHQLFIVAAIFLLLWLARLIAAGSRPTLGQAGTGRSAGDGRTPPEPEPPGRRLLRIGFGIPWIFDGILQAQPAMAIGMPAQVIKPTALDPGAAPGQRAPAEAPAPASLAPAARPAATGSRAALASPDTPGRPRPPAARNPSRPARLLQAAMVRLGVLPSAVASANPNASPIIAQALNGSVVSVVRGGTGPRRPAGAGDMVGRRSVWRLARGSASWRQVQILHVPGAYGSSG